MCLWSKYPKRREYQSFGRDAIAYDLVGRVHLDYLALYRKHTYHEMHTYRLDYVGEVEVGDKKVAYQGSLDELYNNDFEKFVAYSRQDVFLLVKIDKKLRFIDLSNELAHSNGVLFATTLGSVQMIDNAISRSANDKGLRVPAKFREKEPSSPELDEDGDPIEDNGIAGAYVADPIKGMHNWIGAVDINSLYPSVIRALNMSKETIVGQIRLQHTDKLIKKRINEEKKSFAEAWNDTFTVVEYTTVMNRDLTTVIVDFEDGSSIDFTGEELYKWIFENPIKPMTLSANGTIIDLSKEGIVPEVLKTWYSERKILQAKLREVDKIKTGIEISQELLEKVEIFLGRGRNYFEGDDKEI
jgi:DNA polymerase elongation subunit (family B)